MRTLFVQTIIAIVIAITELSLITIFDIIWKNNDVLFQKDLIEIDIQQNLYCIYSVTAPFVLITVFDLTYGTILTYVFNI